MPVAPSLIIWKEWAVCKEILPSSRIPTGFSMGLMSGTQDVLDIGFSFMLTRICGWGDPSTVDFNCNPRNEHWLGEASCAHLVSAVLGSHRHRQLHVA